MEHGTSVRTQQEKPDHEFKAESDETAEDKTGREKNTSCGSESAESHPYLIDVTYYSFFTNYNTHCTDRN